MQVRVRLLIAIAAMAFLAGGCGTSMATKPTPLNHYIEGNDFVAFTLPRSRDGVGTIIDFKDGHESVVASPDPPESQCLTREVAPRGEPVTVATLDTSYDLDRSAGVELDLGRAAVAELDLRTAFESTRVRSVRFRLVEPFTERITRLTAIRYLETLTEDSPCLPLFLDGDNLVIHTVLGAQGLEYTLLDERGTVLTLDAGLLEDIGIGGELRSRLEGSQTLNIQSPILIGYRAWRATEVPGLVGTPVRLEEVPKRAVERQRAQSGQ